MSDFLDEPRHPFECDVEDEMVVVKHSSLNFGTLSFSMESEEWRALRDAVIAAYAPIKAVADALENPSGVMDHNLAAGLLRSTGRTTDNRCCGELGDCVG
jgi:hypothetical protein